jgi:YidC/Oxa1 family membrane protein insertase
MSLCRAWRDFVRFSSLEAAARSLVFYAEDAASWAHFAPIIAVLTGEYRREICYLTSSLNDPVLGPETPPGIRPFYIGLGHVRTMLFAGLRAGVMVMTMPDLQTFHIKRSRHPVHYVYVHHAMTSTHMVWRKGAFDQFDAVFCVGPHHVRELRATEEAYGLKRKILVEHGYGKLETLLALRNGRSRDQATTPPTILVAPSWGPHALLETCGEALIDAVARAGYSVIVRPHPMTAMKRPDVIARLDDRFRGSQRVRFEMFVGSLDSLLEADLMISDWSGVALEYAFGVERPILFMDVPRKVNNPEYERIGLPPIEIDIRNVIGSTLPPAEALHAAVAIQQLLVRADEFVEPIRHARSELVFNVGQSGAVGAAYLDQISRGVAA